MVWFMLMYFKLSVTEYSKLFLTVPGTNQYQALLKEITNRRGLKLMIGNPPITSLRPLTITSLSYLLTPKAAIIRSFYRVISYMWNWTVLLLYLSLSSHELLDTCLSLADEASSSRVTLSLADIFEWRKEKKKC